MKRTIISCFIIIALVFACVLSIKYTENAAENISLHIEKAYDSVKFDDFTSADIQMEKLHTHWKGYANILGCIVRHDEIDEIEQIFSRCEQAVKNSDKNEALIQIKELNLMINHLPEMEYPTLSNIL